MLIEHKKTWQGLLAKAFDLYITRNDILQNGLLMLNFSMGKVIYLPEASKTELSVLMIKTLHAAYKKQKHNKPIGQRELDGSFTALVNRNLIAAKTSNVGGELVVTWYVTAAGLNALRSSGLKT